MLEKKLELNSLEDTVKFAKFLALHLSPGGLVGLRGPLGAGKTELVRACMRAFGVTEDICSPTFVLEAVYQLPSTVRLKQISHWDLYRIRTGIFDGDLLESVGRQDVITFVEWPERVPEIFARLTVDICLDFHDTSDSSECRILIVRVIDDHILEQAVKTKF